MAALDAIVAADLITHSQLPNVPPGRVRVIVKPLLVSDKVVSPEDVLFVSKLKLAVSAKAGDARVRANAIGTAKRLNMTHPLVG